MNFTPLDIRFSATCDCLNFLAKTFEAIHKSVFVRTSYRDSDRLYDVAVTIGIDGSSSISIKCTDEENPPRD